MRARGRAGASAHRKYEAMLRQWRRHKRRLFWTLGAVFVLVGLAANIAAAHYHRWVWGSGVLTGVLITLFTVMRQLSPAHVERWELGAWGEQRTAKQLRKLDRQQWRVLHDLPASYGNFDHIVIGPPGVFLLDTKNWHGEIEITGDVATLRRLEDPDLSCVFDGLPRRMRGLAAELQDRYRALDLRPGWVTPVIVVWARFPQRSFGDDNLSYVHGDDIASWLAGRQPRLRADQILQLEAAVRPAREPSWLRRIRPRSVSEALTGASRG